MRVLLVRNQYDSRLPSGENESVRLTVQALRASGHEVVEIGFNGGEPPARLLRSALRAAARMPEGGVLPVAQKFRPNVVHCENLLPVTSLSTVSALRAAGFPVLVAVRNYRLACIAGSLFRDGQECTLCLAKTATRDGLRYRCYRGSLAASAIAAAVTRGSRDSLPDPSAWLATSACVERFLARLGIERDKIFRWPNFVVDPGPPVRSDRANAALFVGRLEGSKGVRLLLDAWAMRGRGTAGELRFAGAGPDEDLIAATAERDASVRFLGRLTPNEVSREMQRSAVVVVPSLVPETFGRAPLEAMAHGRAVIVSDAGALPELVADETGWVVRRGDAARLRGALDAALGDPLSTSRKGDAGRERYLSHFTPDVSVDSWLRAFRAVAQ